MGQRGWVLGSQLEVTSQKKKKKKKPKKVNIRVAELLIYRKDVYLSAESFFS